MTKEIEVLKPEENQIVEFSKFKSQLAAFKERYENLVYNLDDEDQHKQARSDKHSIGKAISALDSTHKALKAPLKAETDKLDSDRKEIKDDFLGIQGKIKSQLEAYEKAKVDHAEMLQRKVDDIEALNLDCGALNSIELKQRISEAGSIDVGEAFEHRRADALLMQVDTLKHLEGLLDAALTREAEQAELERLREEKEIRDRKERERKIAEDARIKAEEKSKEDRKNLEQAKIDAEEAAERAEQDKIDAADKARRDKKEAAEHAESNRLAAIEKAGQDKKDAVNRERKAADDREEKRIKDEAETKRQEVIETERREKDKKHRAKINNEALESFVAGGMNKTNAKLAVELIAKKTITHVTISY